MTSGVPERHGRMDGSGIIMVSHSRHHPSTFLGLGIRIHRAGCDCDKGINFHKRDNGDDEEIQTTLSKGTESDNRMLYQHPFG